MCVSCVLRVFLHATVACGSELLDVLGIKYRVATLVRESTYLTWILEEIRFKVPATLARPRYSLLKYTRSST